MQNLPVFGLFLCRNGEIDFACDLSICLALSLRIKADLFRLISLNLFVLLYFGIVINRSGF